MSFSDDEDEGPRYMDEFGAYQRAGGSGKLAEYITVRETKSGRSVILPEDRFLINMDAFCRRINAENIAKISEQDINDMLEKAHNNVMNLKYKNHIAFVLGFIASQGGKSLKKENVLYVIEKVLPKLEKGIGIEPPDVVRYARYWREHL